MKHKQEVRKGFEWYRMLTKKQQKELRKNLRCPSCLRKLFLERLFNQTCSAWRFICGSGVNLDRGLDINDKWMVIVHKLESKG